MPFKRVPLVSTFKPVPLATTFKRVPLATTFPNGNLLPSCCSWPNGAVCSNQTYLFLSHKSALCSDFHRCSELFPFHVL
jgi:hypothetical protein